jgi:hypothetical protein
MSRPRIPEEVCERVRKQAGNRCGYCLSRQEYVWGTLEVEHIIPCPKTKSILPSLTFLM